MEKLVINFQTRMERIYMGWFLCYSYPSEFIIHDTFSQLEVVFERRNHFFFYKIIKKDIMTFESITMFS